MNWLDELKTIIPEDRISTNPTVLERHSKDESYHTPRLPDAVIFPVSQEEVSRIMKLAHSYKIPVVPFGVGTSVYLLLFTLPIKKFKNKISTSINMKIKSFINSLFIYFSEIICNSKKIACLL